MTPNQRDALREVYAAIQQVLDAVEAWDAEHAKVQAAAPDVAYDLREQLDRLKELLPEGS